MTDKELLQLATAEGKKGTPPHLYGAVLVVDDKVVAKDHNHVWEKHNPSAHAEISTIVKACQKQKTHNLKNATLYTSHEPCVMCFSCAAWADIDRIVYAVAANELSGDSYEFNDLSLSDLAKKLNKPIQIEQVNI